MEVEPHPANVAGAPEATPADVMTYKIQAIVVIFAIGMAGGLFPLKRTSSQRFLSLGNAFSGGIFLSAAFVEMIAEAVEGFERLHFETRFPFVMFFVVVGILIPFFIERVAMDNHDHNALVSREKNRASDAAGPEQSTLGIYVLWLSLGVHSIIEGMFLSPHTTALDPFFSFSFNGNEIFKFQFYFHPKRANLESFSSGTRATIAPDAFFVVVA
jgi:hypothetical protein